MHLFSPFHTATLPVCCATALVVVLACSSPDGIPCETDEDCFANEECVDDRCVSGGDEQQPDDEPDAGTDRDTTDQDTADATTPECTDNDDCAGDDQVCDEGSCRRGCTPSVREECRQEELICAFGECFECSSDLNCDNTEVCLDNECVLATPSGRPYDVLRLTDITRDPGVALRCDNHTFEYPTDGAKLMYVELRDDDGQLRGVGEALHASPAVDTAGPFQHPDTFQAVFSGDMDHIETTGCPEMNSFEAADGETLKSTFNPSSVFSTGCDGEVLVQFVDGDETVAVAEGDRLVVGEYGEHCVEMADNNDAIITEQETTGLRHADYYEPGLCVGEPIREVLDDGDAMDPGQLEEAVEDHCGNEYLEGEFPATETTSFEVNVD